tara:strand:- start:138 stop:266 length:129 start_codon:yes stop_codon:yes gene_type:complete
MKAMKMSKKQYYPSLEAKRLYEILQNDIDDFKKFLKVASDLK